ncbi:MAG: hypothetical protein RJQ14_04960 [Marinoscillum sp.]
MKNLFCGLLTLLSINIFAQEASLGSAIDELTYKWDTEAKNLNSYEGLSKFCDDTEYRLEVIGVLHEIHHYDSILYNRLVTASRFNKDKEIEKTLDEITKFEKKYSMKQFIHFLHEECISRNAIEKESKESRNDIGANSYDGQIYIIETELNKYIKHITKRVDHLRKHVHHLHIK